MVRFLNTTQSKGEVDSILTNAQNNIVIVSPYIKFDDDLIARLTNAGGKRKIKIKLVCREKDLKAEERAKVESIPNLEIYFNEKVHAKCYYNETTMVITSANLYESLKGDNHEMGVCLDTALEDDAKAFQKAVNEAKYIIDESIPNNGISTRYIVNNPFPKGKVEEMPPQYSNQSQSKISGFCIRCGKNIPLNTQAPFCPKCYSIWAVYKDETFEEKHCHQCGKKAVTSMKKPVCIKCYKTGNKL